MPRRTPTLLCFLPLVSALWPGWHQPAARSRSVGSGQHARSLPVLKNLPVPGEDEVKKLDTESMMKAVYTCNVCETRNMVEVRSIKHVCLDVRAMPC